MADRGKKRENGKYNKFNVPKTKSFFDKIEGISHNCSCASFLSILDRIQPFSLYLLIFEAIQSIICEPLFVTNLIRLYSFFFLKAFPPHKSFFLYFLPLIGIRICKDEPTKKWRMTQRFSPYLEPRDSNRITKTIWKSTRKKQVWISDIWMVQFAKL